jgi:hypothetical protein
MLRFELQETESGFALSGGQLEEPLLYCEKDPNAAIRLVGFLSQQEGSKLRIHASDGRMTMQHREPAVPFEKNSLGSGLRGDSTFGN